MYFKSKIPYISTFTRWTHFIKTQVSLLFFSLQVMSGSLWRHRLQDTRLPCPSPSPRVYPNSCPLNWWCHPIISSSVTLFSFCLQSFPASGSFPTSRLFPSGSQITETSASASVLPMDIQCWFPLGLIGLISLLSKGLSRVFSSTTVRKHRFFSTQPSLWSSSHVIHDYQKSHSFDYMDLCCQVMSLLFNMLSRYWTSC